MALSYQCCFCWKNIKSNNRDVTSLLVITNWDKDENLQKEQQLFCHLSCLKNSLDEKTPLYLVGPGGDNRQPSV